MDNFYTDLIAPCKFVLFMTFTRENRQLYYTGLLINSFILCYIMDLIRAQGANVIIDLEPTLYPGIALSVDLRVVPWEGIGALPVGVVHKNVSMSGRGIGFDTVIEAKLVRNDGNIRRCDIRWYSLSLFVPLSSNNCYFLVDFPSRCQNLVLIVVE